MKSIKENPLLKRALSAIVLAPLAGACIYFGGYLFMGMVMIAALLTMHEWFNMVKNLTNGTLLIIAGTLYLSLSYFSFVFLRFGFEQGVWLTLTVIVCVWVSDVMAYAVGKTVKGPKMCPHISPNKTWTGLGGAMGGFMIVFVIAPLLVPLGIRPVPFWGMLLSGLALDAIAQAGDLMVSKLKRKSGLKDTGQLIPGHGGLLDRIDALLLVTPVTLLLLLIWQG